MTMNRRALLGGVAALAAAPAFARAPLSGAQAPAFYRMRIGDIELTALTDGHVGLDASLFSGVEPAEIAGILSAQGLTTALPTAVNAFVVNSAARTVLIDSGTGANAAFGPNLGRLAGNLRTAGIEPAQIDAVILTHAHTDHAEGLVDAAGAAAFPNAELVLTQAEHAFWADDGVLSRAPEGAKFLWASARKAMAPYAGRMRLAGEGEVFAGIELIASPGHTPGHAVLRVASGGAQALIVGDTLHNAAIHTARPDAGFAFDVDAALAARSRRRIFDMASADGILIAATHVAFPGVGRILRDGDAYRYVPASWSQDL